MSELLLLDASELFCQGFYAQRPLSYNGKATGALYSSLNTFFMWLKKYKNSTFRIALDSTPYLRKTELYPEYKSNREKIFDQDFHEQYTSLLQFFSYLNCCVAEPGYEADDILAKIALAKTSRYSRIRVVSRDSDLYQILTDSVSLIDFKTKKEYTKQKFIEEYLVTPDKWAETKAIAGDKKDNVFGIPGVGIATAIKYLNGKASDSVSVKIHDYAEQIKSNLKLLKLPYDLKPYTEPVVTTISSTDFFNYCESYGFFSFIKREKEILELLNRNI